MADDNVTPLSVRQQAANKHVNWRPTVCRYAASNQPLFDEIVGLHWAARQRDLLDPDRFVVEALQSAQTLPEEQWHAHFRGVLDTLVERTSDTKLAVDQADAPTATVTDEASAETSQHAWHDTFERVTNVLGNRIPDITMGLGAGLLLIGAGIFGIIFGIRAALNHEFPRSSTTISSGTSHTTAPDRFAYTPPATWTTVVDLVPTALSFATDLPNSRRSLTPTASLLAIADDPRYLFVKNSPDTNSAVAHLCAFTPATRRSKRASTDPQLHAPRPPQALTFACEPFEYDERFASRVFTPDRPDNVLSSPGTLTLLQCPPNHTFDNGHCYTVDQQARRTYYLGEINHIAEFNPNPVGSLDDGTKCRTGLVRTMHNTCSPQADSKQERGRGFAVEVPMYEIAKRTLVSMPAHHASNIPRGREHIIGEYITMGRRGVPLGDDPANVEREPTAATAIPQK
jgi:hypothetical protein